MTYKKGTLLYSGTWKCYSLNSVLEKYQMYIGGQTLKSSDLRVWEWKGKTLCYQKKSKLTGEISVQIMQRNEVCCDLMFSWEMWIFRRKVFFWYWFVDVFNYCKPSDELEKHQLAWYRWPAYSICRFFRSCWTVLCWKWLFCRRYFKSFVVWFFN